MSIPKAILACFLYIIYSEIVGALFFVELFIELPPSFLPYATSLKGLISAVILWLFVAGVDQNRELRGPWFPVKYCVIGIVLGVLFLPIQWPILFAYSTISGVDYSFNIMLENIGAINLGYLGVILFFPIAEELFFRSYLQGNLQKRYKPGVAILISALLFSLVHTNLVAFAIDGYSLMHPRVVVAFAGGLISGYLYYLSKSVSPSILFHILWNFMVVIN